MLSKRELENRLGPEAAESAFALRGIDALAEDVVESPKGFHLIRLRSRIEATRGDVSSLRNVIRTRVGAERRARAEADLYAAIESSADVRVDEAALASAGAQETSAHAGR
jgi:peptidyl-prolyl cis-trans isomerase C